MIFNTFFNTDFTTYNNNGLESFKAMLESKAIQGYSWYIKGATLKQEVALYERIARDLKKIYIVSK